MRRLVCNKKIAVTGPKSRPIPGGGAAVTHDVMFSCRAHLQLSPTPEKLAAGQVSSQAGAVFYFYARSLRSKVAQMTSKCRVKCDDAEYEIHQIAPSSFGDDVIALHCKEIIGNAT